eukprot:6492116-Amphidinium_carterae.3
MKIQKLFDVVGCSDDRLSIPDASVVPMVWMLQSNVCYAQAEQHHFAHMRWTVDGTRFTASRSDHVVLRVLMTSEMDLYTYYKLKNPMSEPSFSMLHNLFKAMNSQEAQAYIATGAKIQSSTIACGEVLYIPPATCVAECAHGSTCTWGFKTGLALKSHLPKLEMVAKFLEKVKKSTATVQLIRELSAGLTPK